MTFDYCCNSTDNSSYEIETASATLFNNEDLPGSPFSSEYLKLDDK